MGLGWEAQVGFEEGLARTVDWYRDNESWWRPLKGEVEAQYRARRQAYLDSLETERVTSERRTMAKRAGRNQVRAAEVSVEA